MGGISLLLSFLFFFLPSPLLYSQDKKGRGDPKVEGGGRGWVGGGREGQREGEEDTLPFYVSSAFFPRPRHPPHEIRRERRERERKGGAVPDAKLNLQYFHGPATLSNRPLRILLRPRPRWTRKYANMQ